MYDDISFNMQDYKYNPPIVNDVAVCIAYFNPCKSVRLLMNYLFITEKLRCASIPYFTIEVIFNNRQHEINNAHHVHSNSYMFYKEQLYRILETKIPPCFTKLCFLDADIVFENADWYNEMSNKLNDVQIAQIFSEAHWLDITYKKILYSKLSVSFLKQGENLIGRHHTGFGFGMQRKWYKEVGFFDLAIVGGGDCLFIQSYNKCINQDYTKIFNLNEPNYFKYTKKLIASSPKLSCISGNVYHLYHGSTENRQFLTRNIILKSRNITNILDILVKNDDGLYEFKDSEINDEVYQYFRKRDDDSL